MLKYYFYILIAFTSFSFQAQNSDIEFGDLIENYQNNNNLEAYYYAYIDYYVQFKNSLSPEFLDQAILNQWREPNSDKELISKLHLLINQAYYYKQKGAIHKSIIAYEKALNIFQKHHLTDYNIINYCLKPLSNNYTRIGDYNRAEDLFKYTLSLAEKIKDKKEIIATYLNLSIKYQSIGKPNKAIVILNKAIALKPKKEQLASLYAQIAKNYLLLKNENQFRFFVYKSMKLDTNNKLLATNLLSLAAYNRSVFALDEAIQNYLKALKLIKEKRLRAKTMVKIAAIFQEKNMFEKSLHFYNEALQVLLPSFHPKNAFDLPDKSYFYAENSIKEALDGKASVLQQMHQLIPAIAYYKLSFTVEDLLRDSYTNQNSKILQQQENRQRSEKIVTLYDDLYQKKTSDSIILEMLSSIEQTKSAVLFHAIKKENEYKKIQSDSLFLELQALKAKIASIDAMLQQESLKLHPDIDLLKNFNTKKSTLITQKTLIETKINTKYPFFKESDFDIKKLLLNLMDDDNQIVYYFFTDANLFIFNITQHKITYRKEALKTLFKDNLNQFIQLFSEANPFTLSEDISRYTSLAYVNYKQLLTEELGDNKFEFLTIIPDNQLSFLPFDALLTEKTNVTNFAKLPYLVHQKAINLGYSLSVLNELKSNSNSVSSNKIIGFFPIFQKNHRNKNELKYTQVEKEKIASHFNGLFLENEQATKENFLEKAKKYSIVHVSTHASAGDNLHPATIEFYDQTLLLPEIYGMQFHTNLLVLSACETGIGRMQKGEGLMSLSRGFSYSGVKNLVVSLWKVNDKSTGVLMDGFYKNLKKTANFSESLQLAKINYIEDNKISMYKKNPYYWSAFVFIGNADSGISTTNASYFYIFFILLLIFLGIFIVLKQKKK